MIENFQILAPYLFLAILFFLVVLVFLNVILFLKFKKINRLSQSFFAGKNGNDLEIVMDNQFKQIQKLDKDTKELFDGYEKIFNIASKGIQKVGLLRYNPFKDMGGNQSFSIAMLDRDNSGLVISTLATRDGVRVFSKSIVAGECTDFPLLEEEKKAIKIARSSKKSATV